MLGGDGGRCRRHRGHVGADVVVVASLGDASIVREPEWPDGLG